MRSVCVHALLVRPGLVLVAIVGLAFPVAGAGSESAASPDFLRDVRPILASHCFKCHGQDDKARKSGLRLDVRDDALKPAKSGAHAIVPGKLDASELAKRIASTDVDELMPPP